MLRAGTDSPTFVGRTSQIRQLGAPAFIPGIEGPLAKVGESVPARNVWNAPTLTKSVPPTELRMTFDSTPCSHLVEPTLTRRNLFDKFGKCVEALFSSADGSWV